MRFKVVTKGTMWTVWEVEADSLEEAKDVYGRGYVAEQEYGGELIESVEEVDE